MVATDGHRLSFVEKPGETLEGISGEKRVLIPRKALQELQQLLSNTDAEKVEFADDEHTLFFRVGHRTLSTRRLSGQFPNYRSGHAARQHQVRRRAVERAVSGHPARGAVCR